MEISNINYSIYQDFEDIANFSCKNIYMLNHDKLKLVANYTEEKNVTIMENILIETCEVTKIEEIKNFRTLFERHFQYIRNGMLSIDNFSYESIINHIITDLNCLEFLYFLIM